MATLERLAKGGKEKLSVTMPDDDWMVRPIGEHSRQIAIWMDKVLYETMPQPDQAWVDVAREYEDQYFAKLRGIQRQGRSQMLPRSG